MIHEVRIFMVDQTMEGSSMKSWKLLVTAGLITVFSTAASQAFDPTKVQLVVNDQKDCPWCDLSGADFSGVDLQGVSLEGADLTGAQLTGANLTGVNLTGAYFTGADLTGAKLEGAKLSGATFHQVDFSEVDLTGVDLENTYCDWGTNFPAEAGWVCKGVAIERE
jgi:uncharacterized protein YjbI with pentapeptide repeats